MSRNSAERSRYKKYDYKTHHSSFSQRSDSHLRTDPPSAHRKPSPFKIKKQSTENSFLVPEMTGFDDIRLPLGEIFENSAKVAKALIDPRKDGRNLRNRNAELELKISRQAKEMEDLRIALEGMKELVGTQRAREGHEAREANLSLQARCEVQDREMAALKREVQGLKMMAENEGLPGYVSSQLEESHISRRAQYRQNYEEVASNIPQNTCQHCTLFSQEAQQLRILYESQVRRGKADQQTLLIQEARLLELKDEVEHKNKCIDYLRAQIEQQEQYERLPKQVKTGNVTPQDLRTKRQTPRAAYVRSKPDEPFNSFSEFRY